MEFNKELEEITAEIKKKREEKSSKNELVVNTPQANAAMPVGNITQQTEFSKAIDSAKIETIAKASAEDKQFNDDFKNELKQAVLKSAQLEKEKQELEKKNIELQQNYIKTKSELETQTQSVNKWENKERARLYHYNGLKDIMLFVHINNPMCIPLMYFIAIIVSPIFLIWTLIISPIFTLIAGTKDGERPKLVKGAIYTILLIALVVGLIYAFYALGHYLLHWF